MEDYSGFFLIIDKSSKQEKYVKKLEDRKHFTVTISGEVDMDYVEIFLISTDEKVLDYLAFAYKGIMVATAEQRIKMAHAMKIKNPLTFDHVTNLLNKERLNNIAIHSNIGDGKRLKKKEWNLLLTKIFEQNPWLEKDLIAQWETEQLKEKKGTKYEIIALKRDIANNLLRFAGLPTDLLLEYDFENDKVYKSERLNRIGPCKIRELQLSANDSGVFGDWKREEEPLLDGGIVFTYEDRELSINHVHATPLEQTLGVDLIYYNGFFDSYIMIQYKRMEEENGRFCYRPDASYETEFSKMKEIRDQIQNSKSNALRSYRLNNNFFYFKLCPLVMKKLKNQSMMVPGLYFPLDYWERLLETDLVKGPLGGTIIDKNNSDRYINNSLFIELVQDGWIGSSDIQSDIIELLIRTTLANNRAVTLAELMPRQGIGDISLPMRELKELKQEKEKNKISK